MDIDIGFLDPYFGDSCKQESTPGCSCQESLSGGCSSCSLRDISPLDMRNTSLSTPGKLSRRRSSQSSTQIGSPSNINYGPIVPDNDVSQLFHSTITGDDDFKDAFNAGADEEDNIDADLDVVEKASIMFNVEYSPSSSTVSITSPTSTLSITSSSSTLSVSPATPAIDVPKNDSSLNVTVHDDEIPPSSKINSTIVSPKAEQPPVVKPINPALVRPSLLRDYISSDPMRDPLANLLLPKLSKVDQLENHFDFQLSPVTPYSDNTSPARASKVLDDDARNIVEKVDSPAPPAAPDTDPPPTSPAPAPKFKTKLSDFFSTNITRPAAPSQTGQNIIPQPRQRKLEQRLWYVDQNDRNQFRNVPAVVTPSQPTNFNPPSQKRTSVSKSSTNDEESSLFTSPGPRKRGRPKGSKNKRHLPGEETRAKSRMKDVVEELLDKSNGKLCAKCVELSQKLRWV